jgi:hypothetical protein
MGPCLIEVGHISIEDALELPLVKNQQVVQTFLPHTPQEPLADRIGSGSVIRGHENLDAACRRHTSEEGPKFGIIIPNQVLGCVPIRGRFSERYAPPRDRKAIASRPHGSALRDLSSMTKKAKSGRKNRSVTCMKSQAQTCAVWFREIGRPRLALWLGCANSLHVLLNGAVLAT